MILCKARQLSMGFGVRELFTIDRLDIEQGERIGIVGANGSGKTTLLRLLAGELTPDEGSVHRYCDVAFVRQLEDVQPDTATPSGAYGLAPPPDSAVQSGGERMRLRLSQALATNPMLLFADEPTANLDAEGCAVLEGMLYQVETVVIISHDRALLDAQCTTILALRDGVLHRYPGNYSDYHRQREQELQRAHDQYEAYTHERDRLQVAARQKMQQAAKMTKKPKGLSSSEAKMRSYMMLRKPDVKEKNAAKSAKAVEKRLERLQVHEKPRELPALRIDFELTDPPAGRFIAEAEGLRFAYGERVIFDDAAFQLPNRARIALIGQNGAGKTTLMNLLAQGHPDIRIPPKVRFGYFRQQLDDINPDKTVLENMLRDAVQSEGAVRSLLARLLFRGDDVFKPASVLSGGERVKLSLAMLLVRPCNVLLLDEPTNYLDLPSLEAVQALLADFEGTLLFTSHDRVFTQAVANAALHIGGGKATWHASFEGRQS